MQQTQSDAALRQRNSHIRVAIVVMAVVYLLGVGGLVLLYVLTRCPGGTISVCQLQAEAACGSSRIGGGSDCSAFVGRESCFCDECHYCLQGVHRQHCDKSEAARLSECRADAGVVP